MDLTVWTLDLALDLTVWTLDLALDLTLGSSLRLVLRPASKNP